MLKTSQHKSDDCGTPDIVQQMQQILHTLAYIPRLPFFYCLYVLLVDPAVSKYKFRDTCKYE